MDKSSPRVLIRRTHSGVSLISHTESFHSFDDDALYSTKKPGAYIWDQVDVMSASQQRRTDSGFAELDQDKENDNLIDTMNETKLKHRPSSIQTSASASQSDSASHKPRSISSRTKRRRTVDSSNSSRRNSHHRRSQPSSRRSSELPAQPSALHRAGTPPTTQPARSKPASRKNSLYTAPGGTTSDPYLAHARAKEILQALDPVVRSASNTGPQPGSSHHQHGGYQNVDATVSSPHAAPTRIMSPTSQYTVTSQYSLISPPTHHSMPIEQDLQLEPAPASPPQTIVYWMHPATRLEEYERHDRNRRGVRGFLRKFLVWGGKRTFYEEKENGADDDKGSVRRYRLDLSDKEGGRQAGGKEAKKDTEEDSKKRGWRRLNCFG